jgi:alditol oxidase
LRLLVVRIWGYRERVTTTERNWAGNFTYSAARLVRARSISEVQAEVAAADHIRGLGTRHSFNDIADSDDTIISVVDIDASPVIDTEARTLTIGAGTTYGAAAQFLESHGWALHNMGSLPHISIGGAISTGTHGSGVTNGVLSTAVSGLQFVTADGELLNVTRDDPNFATMPVGLGAFGILTRVTLDIQPTYQIRQDAYKHLAWNAFLEDAEGAMSSAYSVSVFTDWQGEAIDQIWLKSRGSDGVPPRESFRGAALSPESFPTLGESITGNFTEHGTPAAWLDRLPHFRLDATPSNGDEIQTEYFVDLSDAAEALQAVRSIAAAIAPVLLVSELRTAASDDLTLSPAFKRRSLILHFTWINDAVAVAKLLPILEGVLAPFRARPHWGKVHGINATTIASLYPEIDRFRSLAAELDPAGKFWNPYLDRLIARS